MPVRWVARRVTWADLRAIDDLLDECWDEGEPLPEWALVRMRDIVHLGVMLPEKKKGE